MSINKMKSISSKKDLFVGVSVSLNSGVTQFTAGLFIEKAIYPPIGFSLLENVKTALKRDQRFKDYHDDMDFDVPNKARVEITSYRPYTYKFNNRSDQTVEIDPVPPIEQKPKDK